MRPGSGVGTARGPPAAARCWKVEGGGGRASLDPSEIRNPAFDTSGAREVTGRVLIGPGRENSPEKDPPSHGDPP